MTNPGDSSRVFGLDILRAVAILFVVYAHGEPLLVQRFQNYGDINIDGVTIFFVLSGYLIGRILIRDFQSPALRLRALFNFWKRRWLRTIPAYLFVLTMLILAERLLLTDSLPANVPLYYLFSQNIAWTHPAFFPEAWSLAIEEWFYFVMPTLIFFSVRTGKFGLPRSVVFLVVSVIVATLLLRTIRLSAGDIQSLQNWDVNLRKLVVTRLDSIMIGVLGAYLSVYHKPQWLAHKKLLFILGISLFLLDHTLILDNTFWRNHFTLLVTPLASLLLIPQLSSWKQPRYKLLKIFTFISLISYSLYLVHLSLVMNIIIDFLVTHLPQQYTPMVVVYFSYWAISITLAYFSYRYIETPFMRLRNPSPVELPSDSWIDIARPHS